MHGHIHAWGDGECSEPRKNWDNYKSRVDAEQSEANIFEKQKRLF